jgi:23S rRNA pseudouridine1911/1915/1917 synthase
MQDYCVGIFIGAWTKSALKKALKRGYITVNGTIATTATFIKGGETITLTLPKNSGKENIFDLPLKVLYEDEYLAVIHKPAGVQVSGNSFKTIAHALPQNLQRSNLPDATVPQPVHRLDYGTTGILLVGKTSSSIRQLNKMFEVKEVSKTYVAIAIGEMKPQGNIKAAIDDRKAETSYEVVESVPSEKYGVLNLVKLNLHTGRRHQIRKHLSGIGNPILGDQEYGFIGLILKGKGIYLHAFSIVFTHPFTREKISLSDPLPKKFEKIFPCFC